MTRRIVLLIGLAILLGCLVAMAFERPAAPAPSGSSASTVAPTPPGGGARRAPGPACPHQRPGRPQNAATPGGNRGPQQHQTGGVLPVSCRAGSRPEIQSMP